jgi:hypothetical protein
MRLVAVQGNVIAVYETNQAARPRFRLIAAYVDSDYSHAHPSAIEWLRTAPAEVLQMPDAE